MDAEKLKKIKQANARYFQLLCAHWRNFPTIAVWEAAALMHGVNPDELENVVVNDQGDSLDLSSEVRMLKAAIGTGELATNPATVPEVCNLTEVVLESFIAWLRRRDLSALADGLTLPPLGAVQSVNTVQSDVIANDGRARDLNTSGQIKFSMTKMAMIQQHQHDWPTIDADMHDASDNGLSAAKAGARGWYEAEAREWARSKGKLIKPAKSTSLANSMHALVVTKHTLDD